VKQSTGLLRYARNDEDCVNIKNMKINYFLLTGLLCAGLAGCKDRHQPANNLSTEELLDVVQHQTFQYFWDGAEPISGMARERYHIDGEYPDNDYDVVTSGGSGFGIMAIISGDRKSVV
jgi:hypothetical protein